ncbi:MAG: hypothetical protein ACJAZC_000919 [Cryomorphaceae bacterium]|jgi:hypothetical protein
MHKKWLFRMSGQPLQIFKSKYSYLEITSLSTFWKPLEVMRTK